MEKKTLRDQVLEHIHRSLAAKNGVDHADWILREMSIRLEMLTAEDSSASVETGTSAGTGAEKATGGAEAGTIEEAEACLGTGTIAEADPDVEAKMIEENKRFAAQLNDIVYPFIAFTQVMEDLQTDAVVETLDIWNTLPWTVIDRARRG